MKTTRPAPSFEPKRPSVRSADALSRTHALVRPLLELPARYGTPSVGCQANPFSTGWLRPSPVTKRLSVVKIPKQPLRAWIRSSVRAFASSRRVGFPRLDPVTLLIHFSLGFSRPSADSDQSRVQASQNLSYQSPALPSGRRLAVARFDGSGRMAQFPSSRPLGR